MTRFYRDNSLQNMFTAYLLKSLSNTKARYINKMIKLREREYSGLDENQYHLTDFEKEFDHYINGKTAEIFKDIQKMREVIRLLDDNRLLKAMLSLNEKESKIVFARVFGELSFKEIGAEFLITPKQAENLYYYAIRKIKKEMRSDEHEF